jgi:hypothetical protein
MDSSVVDLKAFRIGTPHADTGVREIRELIASGKSFAVLTSISLIPQIARGVNALDMDEEIALKVDQMTKLVMASTADAWLINLPGMDRRHEIYSMEQQMQDEANVKELVASITDAHEHDDMESLSLSFSVFSKELQGKADLDFSLSLVPTYLALAGRAQTLEGSQRPVLVQTRASQGTISASAQAPVPPTKAKAALKKQDTGNDKQRQSPLSSWIGKQLLGQIIPKRHLDKDDNLQMMENYPHGLLAIPSDGYSGQRILVPVDEQKALIKSTHAEIHHPGHTKVHHVLYPLYYWPGMDATIEAVCTACAKCIRATRRRRKLNLDFNPSSQKSFCFHVRDMGSTSTVYTTVKYWSWSTCSLGKQCWNFSQTGRWNERVCQTIMKRIIFSRGVPNELRSNNAPELMQGIVRQVCQYLDITQIVIGGHNPRGNAICERVNQTLGRMIRKLSDLDYKDLKNFLPSFEFMINTTLSSATKRTPFEIAHGLPARTIAQARIKAQRVGRGATDPEILEDFSPVFDGSAVKHILEKAVEIAEEVKAVSEWHRRMTHEGLNQKEQRYNMDHLVEGAKVYFYRPQSVLDVVKKTRKAKHIDFIMSDLR